MAANELSGEERDSLDPENDAAEDLRLLRRYEPVLRFTQGELFLPMSVPAYLATCALERSPGPARLPWRRAKGERLCAPGELTPAAAGPDRCRAARRGTFAPLRRSFAHLACVPRLAA